MLTYRNVRWFLFRTILIVDLQLRNRIPTFYTAYHLTCAACNGTGTPSTRLPFYSAEKQTAKFERLIWHRPVVAQKFTWCSELGYDLQFFFPPFSDPQDVEPETLDTVPHRHCCSVWSAIFRQHLIPEQRLVVATIMTKLKSKFSRSLITRSFYRSISRIRPSWTFFVVACSFQYIPSHVRAVLFTYLDTTSIGQTVDVTSLNTTITRQRTLLWQKISWKLSCGIESTFILPVPIHHTPIEHCYTVRCSSHRRLVSRLAGNTSHRWSLFDCSQCVAERIYDLECVRQFHKWLNIRIALPPSWNLFDFYLGPMQVRRRSILTQFHNGCCSVRIQFLVFWTEDNWLVKWPFRCPIECKCPIGICRKIPWVKSTMNH